MFINSIILARFYDANEIGVIKTLNLYGSIIVVIGTFQIHVSVLKFVTNIPQDYFRIITSIKFVSVVSAITVVLYYIIILIFFRESYDIVCYLIYGLVLIPLVFFNMLQNFYIVTNQSSKIFKQMTLFGLLTMFLTFIIGYFDFNLSYYFTGLLLIYLVMFLPWSKHIILKSNQSFIYSEIKQISDQIRYSIPLTISNLLYFLMSKFDSFWMTLSYSTSIVGQYFVVAFENPLNGIVISSSMKDITHSMSKYHKENNLKALWDVWQSSIFIITSLLFLPSLLLFINASSFITFVFGSQYLDNIIVFKLYCLVPIFRTGSYQSLLRVFGYTKFHLLNTLISFSFTVITCFIISRHLSYIYFPLAYLAGYLVYNVGVVSYISKKEGVSFFKIYGLTIVIKQIFIVSLTYFFLHFLQINNFNFFISNLFVVLIYITIYLIFFHNEIRQKINEFN